MFPDTHDDDDLLVIIWLRYYSNHVIREPEVQKLRDKLYSQKKDNVTAVTSGDCEHV